ncbi:MAG: serine/threonine-protein kinase [Acidimicrobiales bacterium]
MTGRRAVGPYRLLEPLGRGGMGEVWLAEDPTGASGGAPRRVAVKMLDMRTSGASPEVRARFEREVAALRRVDSPFVAALLDADLDADVPWLASVYVAGPTLAEHVDRHGRLAEAPLRVLGIALADALAAVHAAGVVHRDVTPRNVVLGPDGPRLVDFGIAWFPGAVPVTRAGSSVGTPAWMAPERLTSGAVTAASDVWSWGAVMAYAALGRPLAPAPPTDPLDVTRPGSPGARDLDRLPGWLAPRVRAATAVDPAARPTAIELRAGITDAAGGEVTAIESSTAGDATTVLGTERTAGTGHADRTAVDATRRFGLADRRRAGRRGDRTLAWWASAGGMVALAAGVGATTGLLAAVMVATVLVLIAVALQFRRENLSEGARPIPPTWAVTLAAVVVLGVALVQALGPLPGGIVLVVLLVVFVVVFGDILT